MSFSNQNRYPFTAQGIAAYAPARSGVYGIFKQGDWIYIGEAGNIQTRLYDHLNGNSDQSACILCNGASHFTYELVEASIRVVRETALRNELGGLCNQQ